MRARNPHEPRQEHRQTRLRHGTRCHYLGVSLKELVEEIGPRGRPGRVAHVTHPVDPTHDVSLGVRSGVGCVKISVERIEKSGEECITDNPIISLRRREIGQDFRWDRITLGKT